MKRFGLLQVWAGFSVAAAAPPTITSFKPDAGGPGANVIITGTNFSTATAVRFAGVGTSFTINSPTQITAQVPFITTNPNPTITSIVVVNPNGQVSSADDFEVAAGGGNKVYTSGYPGDPDLRNWFDPKHWLPQGVPTSSDHAVLARTGGQVNIAGPGTLSLAGLSLHRTLLNNGRTLNITSVANLFDSSFQGAGSVNIGPGVVTNLFGTSGGNGLGNGSVLNNFGVLKINSGSLLYFGTPTATFNNSGGAITEIRDGQSVGLNGSGIFTNAGTIRKSPTVGTAFISAQFTNTGTVEVPAGTLEFGAFNTVTNSGLLSAAQNGTISHRSNTNLQSGSLLRGLHRLNASLHVLGDTTIGQPTHFGIAQMESGSLDGAGDLTIASGSSFNWSGGTIDGPGQLILENGTVFNISGNSQTLSARTIQQSGVTTWTGNGTIFVGNNAMRFNNLPGAFFDARGNASFGTGQAGTFSNAGEFVKTGGAGTTFIGPIFTNTGTVSAESGTLRFANFTQTTGSTSLGIAGNPTTLSAIAPLNFQGGTLRGHGNINAAINNTGAGIAPGTATLIGALNVTGNYTQSGNGILTFRIGGPTAQTQYDQLNLTGAATLGGALNVTLINNFVPAVGATFTLISNDATDAITGTFSGLAQNAVLESNGVLFRISYTGGDGNDVTITRIAPPTLSIDDVAITEGSGANVNATFTIVLSFASPQTVSIGAIPTNGTAKAPGDFTSGGSTLTFAPGQTTKTVSVPIIGDTTDEEAETFFVLLSSPSNASILRGRGIGSILDDDAPPTISIDDLSVKEYNARQTTAAFRLKLSAPSGKVVKVSYATANGTATAGSDYVAVAPTQVAFTTGNLYAYARVLINGDLLNEPNETFLVNLSSAVNANIADAQATGTILNDDSAPSLSIGDPTKAEGHVGTTNLYFDVSLSKASGQTITVNFATANGTATTASNDYVARNGTLTFAPGSGLTRTITIRLNGDTVVEGNETLFVLLTGQVNATVAKARGTGTIANDDSSG